MKYLKAYEGFDNKSPQGVKLYCDDLLAELRDDNFKTSVEVSGKWLQPLSMKNKSYVHINISKNIEFNQGINVIDLEIMINVGSISVPFKWSDIKEYVDVITNYLSELGFKDMGFGSKIVRRDDIRNHDYSIGGIISSCDLWYVRDEPEETNEELKYQSYQSAASKLSKLGHVKRSAELQKWSDEIKKRESDAMTKKFEEDAKQLGTFQMIIDRGRKEAVEGNFYVSFYFNTDDIDDRFDNWFDGSELWFEFPFAVIPADDETKAKMIENIEPRYGKPNNGMFYFQSMYLNFSKAFTWDSEEEKKSWIMEPKGIVSMEDYGDHYPNFSNRSSAVRFKRALIDIFDGKIVLRETEKDPGGVKGMLMDEVFSERDRSIKELISFIDSLKKISINSLYKD
jgi:hypothetical protein